MAKIELVVFPRVRRLVPMFSAAGVVQPSRPIGSLPQESIREAVVLPGQPISYRVRREIVMEAATKVKFPRG